MAARIEIHKITVQLIVGARDSQKMVDKVAESIRTDLANNEELIGHEVKQGSSSKSFLAGDQASAQMALQFAAPVDLEPDSETSPTKVTPLGAATG